MLIPDPLSGPPPTVTLSALISTNVPSLIVPDPAILMYGLVPAISVGPKRIGIATPATTTESSTGRLLELKRTEALALALKAPALALTVPENTPARPPDAPGRTMKAPCPPVSATGELPPV